MSDLGFSHRRHSHFIGGGKPATSPPFTISGADLDRVKPRSFPFELGGDQGDQTSVVPLTSSDLDVCVTGSVGVPLLSAVKSKED
jgi:hypothetical protein